MRLDSDDFELFGLPRRFALDRAELDARWRDLQAQVHPDRFARDGAAAQRAAMQWAVRVNEAYRRLKDPLQRAVYLCQQAGVDAALESNTAMPATFLMQQMEWREALDAARDADAVESIAAAVAGARQAMLGELGHLIDERSDMEAAAAQARALMFVERFADDIDRRLEALGQ